MTIYLEDKKTIVENTDTEKGKLIPDIIHVHRDEVPFVADKGHYETIKEYKSGGKDVEFIIDEKGQEYKPEEDYDEDILVYIPYTQGEFELKQLSDLRLRREIECFSIINRGKLWYDTLTAQQTQELNMWYQAWLDVTETKQIPNKPKWTK
ncbi:MAG: hypothetical protein RSF40_02210 [Oscillospiraceae bacterium]